MRTGARFALAQARRSLRPCPNAAPTPRVAVSPTSSRGARLALPGDGIIDPAKRTAIIPFPDGKRKLLNVAHTRLKYGGGWSFFICPGCAKLAQ